ncbi:Glycosyltransferase BC10 [Camellia lanceoleosa]|uniref:Glycosyltransferase BC10 n=1 Tax=Camellia lanceoleosa TaxID=1840588 RepID=A0ACC0GBH8_9ERIC|nr:Glycosyltransferase BC10 [Camellia lanceoleosa]
MKGSSLYTSIHRLSLLRRHQSLQSFTSKEYPVRSDQEVGLVAEATMRDLVQWGWATMINAERSLLANALLDFSNERFILLSETCILSFNFTTPYTYLLNSNHNFFSSFDDPRRMGRDRYNKRMWPAISLSDWHKGSQWFEVHQKLAIQVIFDVTYYPVFKDHCKPPCYMDEHHLPTLVTKVCPELTSNRTITWADWSGGGSHPTRWPRRYLDLILLVHETPTKIESQESKM